MDLNFNDLEKLKFLVDMKRNQPIEYKQFLDDMESILIDFLNIARRIAEIS